MEAVAIGFRVRTGRATAVLLSGPASAPSVIQRTELTLHDPSVPESSFPWHAALELEGQAAARALRKATEAARRVALPAVRELVEAARAGRTNLCGALVVGGSDTEPAAIANQHMRAHAEEGRFFPALVAEALEASGVACAKLAERDVEARARAALHRPADGIRAALLAMRKEVGPPWGAREKVAALAAWLVLAEGKA